MSKTNSSCSNTSPKFYPDFKPHEIHIRINEAEQAVSLTFQLLGDFHTMNRTYGETVEKSLQRFSITCRTKLSKSSKKAERSKKKLKSKEDESRLESFEQITTPTKSRPPRVLSENNIECDIVSLRNHELETGMMVELDHLTFQVVVNPPTVISLGAYPRSCIYVGCPIVPQVSIEFGDDYACIWSCETSPQSGNFETVCTDKVYCPAATAIGCKVKVFCSAICSNSGQTGRAVVFYLTGDVQSIDREFNRMLSFRRGFCDFRSSLETDRPLLFNVLNHITQDTKVRGEDELRIMTYNILAEPFATSEQAYSTLYPYCEKEYLQSEFRIQRILAELFACDADVICLQECDLRSFESYLLPLLGLRGYAGHFTCKGSTEGCATFTRRSTLRVVQRIDLPLKNVLRDAPYLKNLYEQRPDLVDVIGGKLGTVAQICVLQSCQRPDTAIVVANTHLFYHPLASFLRAIQCYAITQALECIQTSIEANGFGPDLIELVGAEETNTIAEKNEIALENCLCSMKHQHAEELLVHEVARPVKATVMLCGDLNSSPNIAALQLLRNGFVTEDQLNHVWEEVKYFSWGDRETNFSFTSIHEARQHSLRQQHADELVTLTDENDDNTLASGVDTDLLVEKMKKASLHCTNKESAGLQPVLTHRLGLVSAGGYPEFSNFTPSFQQLLDYVMVQDRHFEVLRAAPCPGSEVLSEFTALPSAVIPSDHISIVVDLKFKS